MRGKIIVAVGTGVAVIALTVIPATAAQWKKSSTGTVDVCFTGTENFDPVARTAADVAAGEWDAVSTNLNVTVDNCATENSVPMTLGLRNGVGEYGLTKWTESVPEGNFLTVDIQFNEVGAQEWITALKPTLGDQTEKDVWVQMFCHEMGHALGLPHSTATDSCMQTVVTKPFLHPGVGDKAALLSLYGGTVKPDATGDDTDTPATDDPEADETTPTDDPATDDTTPPVTIPADDNGDDPTTGDDSDDPSTDDPATGDDTSTDDPATGDDSSDPVTGDESDDPVTGDDTSTTSPPSTVVTIPVIPVIPVGSSDDNSSDPTTGDDSDDPATGDDDSDESDDPSTSVPPGSSTTTVPTGSSTTSTTAKPSKGGDKNHSRGGPCFRDKSNVDPEKVKAMVSKWRAHTKANGGGKHHGWNKSASWKHGQGSDKTGAKNGSSKSNSNKSNSNKSTTNKSTTNGSIPKPSTSSSSTVKATSSDSSASKSKLQEKLQKAKQVAPAQQSAGTHYSNG